MKSRDTRTKMFFRGSQYVRNAVITFANFLSSPSAAHGSVLYTSLPLFRHVRAFIPIFISSDFVALSVPAKNQWSCSSNSFQFCAIFPVSDRGSGGLQRFIVTVTDSCYHFRTSFLTLLTLCDISILQEDLDSLSQWAHKWQMIFNASKCVHLTITRKLSPLPSTYSICNHTIQQVASAKYLGITLTNNLSWSEHITKITNKANSTRAFLQRNLS